MEGTDSRVDVARVTDAIRAARADIVGLNEVMSGTFWSYDYGGAEYDGLMLIREALEAGADVIGVAVRCVDGERCGAVCQLLHAVGVGGRIHNDGRCRPQADDDVGIIAKRADLGLADTDAVILEMPGAGHAILCR